MIRPSDKHSSPAAADLAADRRLQLALQALDPAAAPGQARALEDRILAQWRSRHGAQASHAGLHAVSGRRFIAPRRWVLAAGLALGATLALGLWLQWPDPAFDELLHPDVLSQMAIGEM